MNGFKLSKRSLKNLEGVDPSLVGVVKYALPRTDTDFGVIEGLRTTQRQRELFDKGASQTMNSKHLTGEAVDLLAYVGARGSWELPLYYDIATAIREAAIHLDVGIRWGGCWILGDIRDWCGTMEEATAMYIENKTAIDKPIFIDAPHFELATK